MVPAPRIAMKVLLGLETYETCYSSYRQLALTAHGTGKGSIDKGSFNLNQRSRVVVFWTHFNNPSVCYRALTTHAVIWGGAMLLNN